MVQGKTKVNDAIDIIAIPTNPASGSESNGSAVITNKKNKVKRGISSTFIVPKYAILDPELTCSLSDKETIRSATDIMFHSIERFLCTDDNFQTTTDMISTSVIKNVITLAPAILNNRSDLKARGEMMWCGTLSNCGLTGLGRKVEFPIHQLGHQISAHFNVPHADSLTAIWNAWADYEKEDHAERFAKLGKDVFGYFEKDETVLAGATINEINDLWEKWEMPTSLRLCCDDLSDENIYSLIDSITNHGKRIVGDYWDLNHSDISFIIERAAI